MTFCVLAADAEDEGDVALQIHFTLIQAFCCENHIDIVRVGDLQRLAAIVGGEAGAPGDLHCILISVSVPRLPLLHPPLLHPWAPPSPGSPAPGSGFPRPGLTVRALPPQNPHEDAWKDPALEKLSLFCEESRGVNDWVPSVTLPE